MGPRQRSGWESSTSIPIEIAFTPPSCGGMIFCFSLTDGKTFSPNKIAALGPWTSQSISPTRASPPFEYLRASARAKFTATVLLPTPPLPEATATMNLTSAKPSGTCFAGVGGFFDGSSASNDTLNFACGNFSASTADASRVICSAVSGAPPVKIRTSAKSPSALTYFTIPNDTISLL